MWSLMRAVVPSVTRVDRRGRKFLAGRDALVGLRLILANEEAVALIHSIHIGPHDPLEILCAVPRVSDDADADGLLVEETINATVAPLA